MNKLLLILAMSVCLPVTAEAASLNSQLRSAQKSIKNNKLEDALKTLVDAQIDAPEDPILAYHLGQVYYKMERYQEADSAFKQALRTDNSQLKADSTYALGNTAFKNGQLKEAIEYFSQAVEMRPDDEDAKYNLDLAREELRRLLEEQKKQQEQQQQQQQQEQQNKEQCDNPQPSDNGEQNQQKSEQQDQNQEQKQEQEQAQQQQEQQEQDEQKSLAQAEEQEQDQEQTDETASNSAQQDEQQTDQENEEESAENAAEDKNQPQQQQAAAAEETEDEGQVSQREAEQTLRRLQEQPPAPTIPGKQRRRVTKDW